jgi:hypothetical protein
MPYTEEGLESTGILVPAPSMHGQEAASLRIDFMGEEYLTTKSTKDTKDDFFELSAEVHRIKGMFHLTPEVHKVFMGKFNCKNEGLALLPSVFLVAGYPSLSRA